MAGADGQPVAGAIGIYEGSRQLAGVVLNFAGQASTEIALPAFALAQNSLPFFGAYRRSPGSLTRAGAMDFVGAIKNGFWNYASASGRAARSEFWYWCLFSFLAASAGTIVDLADIQGYRYSSCSRH